MSTSTVGLLSTDFEAATGFSTDVLFLVAGFFAA